MNTKLEALRQRGNPYHGLSLLKGDKGDPGEKGDPGLPGVKGDKPKKGEDYFTTAEIDEIVVLIQSQVKDGAPGKRGADAKAPVKGLDYWTKDEQEAIIRDVLKRVPKPPKAEVVNHQAVVEAAVKKALAAQKLTIEHIADLPKTLGALTQHLKMGGFRGGGGKVLAGSNVTVTNNADGSQTVASSGGSGFTTLAATETPNGILQTFTFATAAAKPSFIIADGAWKEATDQDGVTINWTWNAGAKQATMTIAPTSGIKGIA